jgi:hypothetical protein
MPWSCAAGITWVETSSFAVAPQTTKVPARTQNVRAELGYDRVEELLGELRALLGAVRP